MLERYGTAVELDLAFHTSYRMSMFWSGEETLTTLVNLVEAFEARTTSYLSAAKGQDVELYELTMDQPRRKGTPQWVEETPEVALLKGISEQLQVLAHLTAKRKGRAKVKPYPRPLTAEQLYWREQSRKDFEHINQMLKFVPNEQFQATIQQAKEHQDTCRGGRITHTTGEPMTEQPDEGG